jgi:cysteine desulfurase
MKKIYLDYAATTPVHTEVVKEMLPYFSESYGNPSSIYSLGQEASKGLEQARTRVASLIGAKPEEMVFTGGGTEADNFAFKGLAFNRKVRGKHFITTVIEHHAVLETARFLSENGFEITYLGVDGNGFVDPDEVRKAIRPDTVLVSIMHANNEIGTIQPIAEIGYITRQAGVLFHTDAVQTVGHIPVDVNKMGIDLLSISSHKLYGPKGVGALYIRKGISLVPLIHGGQQEQGRRASTENVAGIVGFGKAADIARVEMADEAVRITNLRDRLINGLLNRLDSIKLNGDPVTRLPNNVNISVDFVEGEALCLNLDTDGICSSTGSACSSANAEPSHVLTAIGVQPPLLHGSLRFSLGKWTTEEEIDRTIESLTGIVNKLRAMSPLLRLKNGGWNG